jgi:hypothetical protein
VESCILKADLDGGRAIVAQVVAVTDASIAIGGWGSAGFGR